MRPKDRCLADRLRDGLSIYSREVHPLPGIYNAIELSVFIEQLISSEHRVRYVRGLLGQEISPVRAEPNDLRFHPIKAAVLRLRQGEVDEASWLVFLAIHFGQHSRGGWRYVRDVYGRLGEAVHWDWRSTSSNPAEFNNWIAFHAEEIRLHGAPCGFGNHRKYESLTATGPVVVSYVSWITEAGGHREIVQQALEDAKGNPRQAFDALYVSMRHNVRRFGRLACFDYLAMLSKLELAPIEPDSTYLKDATGPLQGARKLFGDGLSTAGEFEQRLRELDKILGVGMQVLEDALCNWQKSPTQFRHFRG